MKDIKDIIKELTNHPDYVHGEIFIKQDYINEISDYLIDNRDEFDTDEKSWAEAEKYYQKNKESIADDVSGMFSSLYEYTTPFDGLWDDLREKYPESLVDSE